MYSTFSTQSDQGRPRQSQVKPSIVEYSQVQTKTKCRKDANVLYLLKNRRFKYIKYEAEVMKKCSNKWMKWMKISAVQNAVIRAELFVQNAVICADQKMTVQGTMVRSDV